MEKDLIRSEKVKELNKCCSKLKSLISNKDYGFNLETVDNVKLVMKDNKIYIPMTMRKSVLNWYHYMLNHPGGDRLGNTIKQNCYCKGLSNQAKKYVKT